MFWIILAFVVVVVIVMSISINEREKTIKSMSDEELKKGFISCAEKIDLCLCSSGLTGIGSRAATNKANEEIAVYRAEGTRYAEELAARGYTVNISVLNGECTRGPSRKSVIGSAIVGGVIAGAPGAIVGAIHAASKNAK